MPVGRMGGAGAFQGGVGNALHRVGQSGWTARAFSTRPTVEEREWVSLADREPDTQLGVGRMPNMEATEKQRAIEALRALPEHATMEEAIERLCFIAKIEEGLSQSDARQLVPHDEIKQQFLS